MGLINDSVSVLTSFISSGESINSISTQKKEEHYEVNKSVRRFKTDLRFIYDIEDEYDTGTGKVAKTNNFS